MGGNKKKQNPQNQRQKEEGENHAERNTKNLIAAASEGAV